MLEIHYTEEGQQFNDFNLLEDAQEIIDHYKNDGIDVVRTSTKNIITALRLLVCRGKIKHNEICFIYEGNVVGLNKKCEFDKPFMGNNWELNYLKEILKKNIEMSQQLENENINKEE